MAQAPASNPFLTALGVKEAPPVRSSDLEFQFFQPPGEAYTPEDLAAMESRDMVPEGVQPPEVGPYQDVPPAFGPPARPQGVRTVPFTLSPVRPPPSFGERVENAVLGAYDWTTSMPEFAQKILAEAEQELYKAPPGTATYNLAVTDLFLKEMLMPFTTPINAAALATSGGAAIATRAAIAGKLSTKAAQIASGISAGTNTVAGVPATISASQAIQEAIENPTAGNVGAAAGNTLMAGLNALGVYFDAKGAVRPVKSRVDRPKVVSDAEWDSVSANIRMAESVDGATKAAAPEAPLQLAEAKAALPEGRPQLAAGKTDAEYSAEAAAAQKPIVLPSDETIRLPEARDEVAAATAREAAKTTDFNARVKRIIETFREDGIQLKRNQAADLARITDPRQYSLARQTILDTFRPISEDAPELRAERQATKLKGFEDLTPEMVGVKPEEPVAPKKAGVVVGKVPVLEGPEAAAPVTPAGRLVAGEPRAMTRRQLELEVRTPVYDSGIIDPATGKTVLVNESLQPVEPRPYGGPRTPEEIALYQKALDERVQFEKRAAALDRVDELRQGESVVIEMPDTPAPIPAMFVGKAMQGNSVVTTGKGVTFTVPNITIYRPSESPLSPPVPLRTAEGPAYVGRAMQGQTVPMAPVAAAAEVRTETPVLAPQTPEVRTVAEPVGAARVAEKVEEIKSRIEYLDELKATREITPDEHKALVADAKAEMAAVRRGAKAEAKAESKTPEQRKAERAELLREVAAKKGMTRRRTAEEWADDVIKKQKGKISSNPFLDPEWVAANAIKGSLLIARGATRFADWAIEMVKEQGEAIRPHLEKLWEYIQTRRMVDEVADYPLRMGTSNPTAAGAVERGHTHNTVIDLERLNRDPKLKAKLENAIRKTYPYLKLGNDPIGALVKHVKDNLLFLYDRVPEEIRAQTKRWYDGARKLTLEWSDRYDLSREQVAGVLAALSPQKDWFQNIALAERIIDTITNPPNRGRMTEQMDDVVSRWLMVTKEQFGSKALSDKTRQMINDVHLRLRSIPLEDLSIYEQAVWVRAYSEAHLPKAYSTYSPEGEPLDLARKKDGQPRGLAWSGFENEISSAIAILRDGSRENISNQLGSAHKVRSFYNNILLPNDLRFKDVTIDTHAVAAGLLKPLSGTDIEVSHALGAAGGSDVIGVHGTYAPFAEAYRQAAAERGVLPREMQSITWEAIRGLFPAELKRGKNIIGQVVEGGEGVPDAKLKTQISQLWNDYGKGTRSLDETRKLIETTAGGIRIPEWLRSDRGIPEGQRAPRNIGELPRIEPIGLKRGFRGGGGGVTPPEAPGRMVPEEYPGDLSAQSIRGMRERYLTNRQRASINFSLLNALGQVSLGSGSAFAIGYNKDEKASTFDRVINGMTFAAFGGLVGWPRLRSAVASGIYNAKIPNKYLRFGVKKASAGNDNYIVFLESVLKNTYDIMRREEMLAASYKEQWVKPLKVFDSFRNRASSTDWATANRAMHEPGLFDLIGDPKLRAAALAARTGIDDLTTQMLALNLVRPGSDLENTMQQNRQKYLTRTYRIFTDPDFQLDPVKQARAQAEYVAQMQSAGSTKTVSELKQEALEIILHQVAKVKGTALGVNARSFAMGNGIARVDGSILKPRKALSDAWRDMLGEISDPVHAATLTIDRQANIIAAYETQKLMAQVGLDIGLFKPNASETHPVELVSKTDDTPLYGDPYGPLRGLWTTKDVADALATYRSYDSQSLMWRLLQMTTGKVKIGLTALHPITYAPNLISAIGSTIIQGHGINLIMNPGSMRDAAAVVFDQTDWPNAARVKSDIPRLIREGILGQNVMLDDLLETARLSGSEDLARSVVTWLPSKLGKAAKWVTRGALNAYGKAEELPRLVGFYGELNRYSWALFGKKLKDLSREEEAIAYQRAIEVTRELYPMSREVPLVLKKLSTAGLFNPFVSFQWEVYRNSFNTVRRAKKDIEEAYDTKNPRLLASAATRLTAFVGIVGGAYMIGQAFNEARGVKGEQGEAIRRRLRSWDQTGQLAIIELTSDEVAFANQSYLLPQANMTAAIQAGLSGDRIDTAFLRFVREVGGQFLGDGGLVIKPVINAFITGKNEYGRDISPKDAGKYFDISGVDSPEWRKTLLAGQDVMARAEYLLKKWSPGAITEGNKWYKAANEEMGPDGQVYDINDLALRLAGVRINRLNIPFQFELEASKLASRLAEARQHLTNVRGRRDLTPEKLDQAYNLSEQARKVVFRDTVQYVRDMEIFRRPQEEAINNLRKKGVPSEFIIGALYNVYTPSIKEERLTARELYNQLQMLPSGARDAEWARLVSEDPKTAQSMVPMMKEEYQGITGRDRLFMSLDSANGNRAVMIALATLSQPNKNAGDLFYTDLFDKGLISGETAEYLWGDPDKSKQTWAKAGAILEESRKNVSLIPPMGEVLDIAPPTNPGASNIRKPLQLTPVGGAPNAAPSTGSGMPFQLTPVEPVPGKKTSFIEGRLYKDPTTGVMKVYRNGQFV